MPSAHVVRAASSDSSRAAATVAPNTPHTPVAWKPRRWNSPSAAAPRRATVSQPATYAVTSSRPLAPVARGDGQRRRRDDRGDVADRPRVGVVEVEGVHERAVGQGGRARRHARAGTDEIGLGGAAGGLDDGARLDALAQGRGRVGAADRVEDVQDGALAHARGDVVVAEARPRRPRAAPPPSSAELELDPGRVGGRAEGDVHRHRLAHPGDDRAEREPTAGVRAGDADRCRALAQQRAGVGAAGDRPDRPTRAAACRRRELSACARSRSTAGSTSPLASGWLAWKNGTRAAAPTRWRRRRCTPGRRRRPTDRRRA